MKKWHVVLLILLGVGALGYWFAAIPATVSPAGSDSMARFTPGPYEVLNETFTIIDPSRPTAAYNDYAGDRVRTLNGEIWRPVGLQQAGPLIIYSHGFMSFRQEGLYLTRFLASHGYTVVAVDYPLSGFHAPDGPLITDVVNQPGDISFLIDTMLQRNGTAGDVLFNTIDPKKIAVTGVSLGGLTSTLVTFHRQLRDPRIAAAISVGGPSSMLMPEFFAGVTVPYLMIYGEADAIVPLEKNGAPIVPMVPESILVVLKQASHAAFAQPAATVMRFVDNPDGLGCRAVSQALGEDFGEKNTKFMAQLGGTENGIDLTDQIEFCTQPLIPIAMQAARQHMFTTLASFAFLESVFADDNSVRQASLNYLLQVLPRENSTEVSVER